jgi:hypothetical protein
MNMNEVKAIEAITKDILSGLYGSIQSAGTETQKYTCAYLQAREYVLCYCFNSFYFIHIHLLFVLYILYLLQFFQKDLVYL